ncbi:MAG: TetR family transcriptional regulator C-terminal domain-containing protein [Hyphomicrobiaceae bacterium]
MTKGEGKAGTRPGRPTLVATRPPTRNERKQATRQELIQATIDAIAEGGLSALTLGKITQRADLSRGLVNFHFRHKEQLLVETLSFLTEEYRQSWRQAVARAGADPAAELEAIVRNDFHPAICNRKKVAVWFAFRGESKARPTYLEVCKRADDEFSTVVTGIVGRLVAAGGYRIDPQATAIGLQAMIEGLWLDCLMYPQSFRREDAMATVMSYLAAVMPDHFSVEPPCPAARASHGGRS